MPNMITRLADVLKEYLADRASRRSDLKIARIVRQKITRYMIVAVRLGARRLVPVAAVLLVITLGVRITTDPAHAAGTRVVGGATVERTICGFRRRQEDHARHRHRRVGLLGTFKQR
jgi:hypothetical protein